MLNFLTKACTALVLSVTCLSANAYVVGGAAGSLTPDSGPWSWDGSYLTGFRSALTNPLYFGPGGVVNRSISIADLASVDAGSLAGIDMFVSTWISDTNGAAMAPSVLDFFLNGGDLFLLQDDSDHDILGTTLGMSTSLSAGSVSNGGVPLFDGPFGVATDVKQYYAVGKLDEAEVLARNGHVGGRNAANEVTSAYWKAGEYAPGAGALFIIADIDMIATTTGLCPDPTCGATYSPLNNNGIYALNTFSFLQDNGGTSVPEPGNIALAGTALGLLVLSRRRKLIPRR